MDGHGGGEEKTKQNRNKDTHSSLRSPKSFPAFGGSLRFLVLRSSSIGAVPTVPTTTVERCKKMSSQPCISGTHSAVRPSGANKSTHRFVCLSWGPRRGVGGLVADRGGGLSASVVAGARGAIDARCGRAPVGHMPLHLPSPVRRAPAHTRAVPCSPWLSLMMVL